jgi:hypothetical protein
MVNSGVTRNHISLETIKWLRLPHRQKENLYPLVTILENPIIYKDGVIYFKTRLVELELKGRHIIILFNMLPLRKDKAVLKMPFL